MGTSFPVDVEAPLQEWVQTVLETQTMHLADTTFDDSDGRYIFQAEFLLSAGYEG